MHCPSGVFSPTAPWLILSKASQKPRRAQGAFYRTLGRYFSKPSRSGKQDRKFVTAGEDWVDVTAKCSVGTWIGLLQSKGISVEKLAKSKSSLELT